MCAHAHTGSCICAHTHTHTHTRHLAFGTIGIGQQQRFANTLIASGITYTCLQWLSNPVHNLESYVR